MPIDPNTGLYIPSPPAGYGYGGPEYGFSPYGSALLPREPVPVNGGYGGQPYGYGPYGTADIINPRVSSAQSLDGFRVEVFFSEEMKDDAALIDPANYTFTPVIGAPATAVSVVGGTAGSFGGYTSVIVTHSGTTLSGSYTVAVANVIDLSDNVIEAVLTAAFFSLGSPPTYTVAPQDGDTLLVTFSHDMLTEAEFTPGIETLAAYSLSSAYPVPLTVTGVSQTASRTVELTVKGQTSVNYSTVISDAEAIDFDGDVLPSAASGFTGAEVGTGTTESSVNGILLTKEASDTYGWSFADTSGKILANSSYRADIVVTPNAAVYYPALGDTTLGTLVISDGAVQLTISLKRNTGVDVLDIVSGGYSAQVPAAWSTAGDVKITVVRNQKADHYGILFNDTPLVSVATGSLNGAPSISPGCQFTLGAGYEVTKFPFKSVDFTSSQTVFSSAWNFLHGVSSSFTGSAALTRSTIQTKRGPLTRGWGDGTPATKGDVTVRVNGTAVTVDSINPYTGQVHLATPIPLMPVGEMTVAVDYNWFPSPLMRMAALNTEGSVLNKWDHPRGRNSPGVSSTGEGVADTSRFPMSIVLGPLVRPKPKLIGHRYIGFERDQSALLNSPTLLLNRDPHRAGLQDMNRTPPGVAVAFTGPANPTSGTQPWELSGTESGIKNFATRTWIVDDQADNTATVYYREEDLSFSCSVIDAVRLRVESYTPTGVFTGVGFGVHDNHNLYLVGFIEVNAVKHIAMITDASKPELVGSWEVGLKADANITASNVISVSTAGLPLNLEGGIRFQVLTGSQMGIYTIDSVVNQTDGSSTITLKESFPADFNLWGNDQITLYFEVSWDSALATYRLVLVPETGAAELYVGGTLAGQALTRAKPTAYPAQTSLLLSTGDQGQFFFGSLSKKAQSKCHWAFRQYGIQPDYTTYHSRGLVVAAEMGDVPENDPNHEWFLTQEFGLSQIDSSGDTLLLKGSSGDLNEFGYGRVEPYLQPVHYIDLDAQFKVETGTAPGDASIVLQDGNREVLLGTLLFQEVGANRNLVSLENISLNGTQTPTEGGWQASTGNTLTATALNSLMTIKQVSGQTGTWYSDLDNPTTGGRVLEARLAILSNTAGTSGGEGPVFGAEVGTAPAARTVAVGFLSSPARVILHSDGTPIASFEFDWSDGEQHVYRVLADPTTDVVSLLVDDVLQGTATLSSFTLSTTDTMGFIGTAEDSAAFEMEVDWFHVHEMPQLSAKRTLGILVGDDPTNIDHWALPRTDATNAPNSVVGTALVEEMDWRELMRLRLHRDPAWGVSLLRPDLPLPSGAVGDFATQTTEPSRAWINVEYSRLPRSTETFGTVRWGALAEKSVTQQRWKEVRYRIYQYTTEDHLAPHHMVLNRYNIIHSGELGTDVTVESVMVNAINATTIYMGAAHMSADRIFSVVVDNAVLPRSTWSFDKLTQALTLTNPLDSENKAVTVTFAPGKPVTTTWLQAQPLHQTLTKLNEGTPPFPKSQVASSTTEVQYGSRINDPNDTLGDPDFILNDPYRTVQFKNDDDACYENLEFFEDDDGGEENLLSMLCDGPAPGMGLAELEFEGTLFTEQFGIGKQDALISDSLDNNLQQTSLFFASGGNYTGGVLAPGSMVLWPNAHHTGQPEKAATRKRVTYDLKIRSVLTDANDVGSDTALEDTLSLGTDNNPPATVEGGNGTAGTEGNGAVVYELEDGAGLFSRLGPWGPQTHALDDESLLAGGASLNGTEFVLLGGSEVGKPSVTAGSAEAAN